MDINFKLDDKANVNPINLIIIDNNIYVSKNIISEFLRLNDDLLVYDLDDTEVLVYEKLIEELKDYQYIAFSNANEIISLDELSTPAIGFTYKDNNVLIESAKNYLTKAFKGFESKLIKKTSNGYSMELNAADVWSLISRLNEYVNSNKELIFDETIKYLEAVSANLEFSGNDDIDTTDIKAAFEELKGQKQDFFDAIDEIYSTIKTMETEEKEELDNLINMFGDSYLKNELSKNGNIYRQNIDAKFMFEGILGGNLKSITTITPKSVEKTDLPNKVITTEELEKLNEKIENKYNPIMTVAALWIRGDSEKIAHTASYKSNNKPGNDVELPYVIIEGRIYLPMRYICEEFGEQVDWDATNRKAYVIRGNEKIDMTGIIVDGKTMIKVRDFEKLNYQVDYEEDDVFALATITKKK